MQKIKLMTIVGTRPEIIKLSEIIKKCDYYFEHILVHTGQNYDYELNEIFFNGFGLRTPDYYLNVSGDHLGETIGNVLSKSYSIIEKNKPDALLILGDTNSALSSISAKRLKVPIFHMEAGNRCFDENLPEEINRKIIDHISDVNLAYTEHARRFLLFEGIKKDQVFVIGSPMLEVINSNRAKIDNSSILKTLNLKKNKYFLLSAHREENIDNDSNFIELMNAINSLADTYKLPIIYSMHPRSKKYIEQRNFIFNKLVKPMKPFGFHDYISLQKNALCVVSDSGTLAEESSILNFPAVSIRTSTERQEVLDKGSFIIGSISEKSILQSVKLSIDIFNNNENSVIAPDYNDSKVSR
ncbi:MAG: UDP-N-acetylglucosamine 2-epimerase (non-hydrolyzing), partial [Patescibacteria group bacterium]